MVPRSARSLRLASLAFLVSLVAAAPAAAQMPQPTGPPIGVSGLGVVVSLVGTFLLNLVVDGILVAVAPEFVRDVIRRVRADPGEMALYGLITIVGGAVALIALAITIIGLIVAIPGALVFGLYLFVTGVASSVAVGYLLLDAVGDATLWSGLLVGAVLSAVLSAVPVLGGILNFVVGLFGLGAVSIRLYERYRG